MTKAAGIALIVAGLTGAYLMMPANYSAVKLSFPAGTPPEKIIAALGGRGVVRSPTLLSAALTVSGRMRKVTPGVYTFDGGEDFVQVWRLMSRGGMRETVAITIPEGYTNAQIAQLLEESGLVTSKQAFLDALKSPEQYAAAAPRLFTILQRDSHTADLEGFLFPATYDFAAGMPPERIIEKMLRGFHTNLPPDTSTQLKTLQRSLREIIIIASMIEREAAVDRDRPLIASVIYNRLKKGMLLQIDATVAFALNKWERLYNKDKEVDSPYNTYKYAGLPPAPIGNPGAASIFAALHPAKTGYLYYVAQPDGSHAFSSTFGGQIRNIQRACAPSSAPGV
ncbi:MAG: endolytic transglycosylase MltG [bacterium]